MSNSTPNVTNFIFGLLDEENLGVFLKIRNTIRHSLHDPREFTLESCKSWFHFKSQDYWLIFQNRIPIGYFRFELDRLNPEVGIIGMDLDIAFQGRGYEKRLYRKFCDEILPNYGPSELRLRVLKSNTRAYHLYISMGMEILEETQVDYEMGCNVEQLLKRLHKELG